MYNHLGGVYHGKAKEVFTRILSRSDQISYRARILIFKVARYLGVSAVSFRHWVLKLHGDPNNPKVPEITPEAKKNVRHA